MKLSTFDSALKGAYSMPVGITTSVNRVPGKGKTRVPTGNLAHNRRYFAPYSTDGKLYTS